MVHLAGVPNDSHVPEAEENSGKSTLTKGFEKLGINSNDNPDTFTTSVYGSKYAAEDLPKHVMPEESMPKEVAYRMIKDDLSLDGNPILK